MKGTKLQGFLAGLADDGAASVCLRTNIQKNPKKTPAFMKSSGSSSAAQRRVLEIQEPVNITLLARSLNARLHRPPGLTRLELVGIHLTRPALQTLAKGIAASESLQVFTFALDPLPDDYYLALHEGLLASPSLQELTLSACELSSQSFAHVAHLVRVHGARHESLFWRDTLRGTPGRLDGLRKLALRGNPGAGVEAIESLMEALAHDRTITSVDLRGCPSLLTLRGARALSGCLLENRGMLTVAHDRPTAVTPALEPIDPPPRPAATPAIIIRTVQASGPRPHHGTSVHRHHHPGTAVIPPAIRTR
ncbi:putative centrosomal protein CEP78 [Paratrimastix pyriformis]|uniref:Centrosomal protein CEP78 n=1 Tax=Paratrimastix pyriformis TaxID=342808 RepID=A0ABQ8UCZ4_9EUKA|nr:putative centrosomal protein CEP78 [Paratrimastix pyriformis]